MTKTMTIAKTLLASCLLFFCSMASAQELLTLEDCMQMAVERNIDVKIAENNIISARTDKTASFMNFLPNLNGNIDYSWYTGTFFDTRNSEFVSNTTGSSDPQLTSGIVLFQGFNNQYNRLNAQYSLEVARYAAKDARLTAQVAVVGFYLTVLTSRENMKVSKERMELFEKQAERALRRTEIGVENKQNYYNLKSQLAAEQLNYIQQQNAYERNKLLLMQVLQIENPADYEIASIEVAEEMLNSDFGDFSSLVDEIIARSPSLRRAQMAQKVAKYSFKQAQSAYYPVLTFSAGIFSSYSTNGIRDIVTGEVDTTADYTKQLDFNQGFGRGFNLRIPIFNRWQNRAAAQRAKIAMFNAELEEKRALNNVVNLTQQAYLDLQTAIASYDASMENLESFRQAYEFSKTSWEAGQLDFYSYFESLNNKNTAELQLINAQYTIILRKRIFDLYLAQQ